MELPRCGVHVTDYPQFSSGTVAGSDALSAYARDNRLELGPIYSWDGNALNPVAGAYSPTNIPGFFLGRLGYGTQGETARFGTMADLTAWFGSSRATTQPAGLQTYNPDNLPVPRLPHPDASNQAVGPNVGGEDGVMDVAGRTTGTPTSGSSGGGALVLVGLAVLALILLKRD